MCVYINAYRNHVHLIHRTQLKQGFIWMPGYMLIDFKQKNTQTIISTVVPKSNHVSHQELQGCLKFCPYIILEHVLMRFNSIFV